MLFYKIYWAFFALNKSNTLPKANIFIRSFRKHLIHLLKFLKKILILWSILFGLVSVLTACMGESHDRNNDSIHYRSENSIPTKKDLVPIVNDLVVDDFGVLPPTFLVNKPFVFRIHNKTNQRYILDHIDVLNTGGETPPIITPLCRVISANTSCSVQLVFHHQPKHDVILTFTIRDELKKTNRQLRQIVRVNHNETTVAEIAASSDPIEVVGIDNRYNIALPIVLQQDFEKLRVSNGSIVCNTVKPKQGTSCTYLLSGLVANAPTLISAKIIGHHVGKDVEVYSQNILIRNMQSANLLLPNNIILNANNGINEAEIQVFNSGSTSAKIQEISIDSPLTVLDKSSCEAPLGISSPCSIKVGFNSTSSAGLSGYSTLKISYTDLSNKKWTVATNIYYQTIEATASIIMEENGGLNHIPLIHGISVEKIITLKNRGNAAIENLIRQLQSSDGDIAIIPLDDSEKPCNNGIVLEKESFCKIKIRFTPIKEINNGSIKLSIFGEYTNKNKVLRYQAQYQTGYSSIANPNILTLSKIEDLKVLPNGISTADASFIISNTFPAIPIKIDQLILDPAINNLLLEGDCAAGVVLDSNHPSCKGLVKYGRVNSEISATSSLKVNFSAINAQYTAQIKSNSFKVEANNRFKSKIIAEVKLGADRPLAFYGSGSENDPYSLLALSAREKLTLIYRFTNIGEGAAEKFYLTSFNSEMIDIVASDKSCPTSANTSFKLGIGESCELEIRILGESFLSSNQAFKEYLSVGSLTIPVGYEYKDISGLVSEVVGNLTQYINFSRNWSNEAYTTQTQFQKGKGWKVEITATANPLDIVNTNNDVFPLLFTPYGQVLGFGAEVNPCSISKAMDTCKATVFFPIGEYPSDMSYTFMIKAKGDKIGDINSLHQSITIYLPKPK